MNIWPNKSAPFLQSGIGIFKKVFIWSDRGVNKEHLSGERCRLTKAQDDHSQETLPGKEAVYSVCAEEKAAPRG